MADTSVSGKFTRTRLCRLSVAQSRLARGGRNPARERRSRHQADLQTGTPDNRNFGSGFGFQISGSGCLLLLCLSSPEMSDTKVYQPPNYGTRAYQPRDSARDRRACHQADVQTGTPERALCIYVGIFIYIWESRQGLGLVFEGTLVTSTLPGTCS